MAEADRIRGLEGNISELIARYEAIKARNEALSGELAACRAELEKKDKKIKDLIQRTDTLQLTLALSDNAGSARGARRRVARLIQEIDACIDLLCE